MECYQWFWTILLGAGPGRNRTIANLGIRIIIMLKSSIWVRFNENHTSCLNREGCLLDVQQLRLLIDTMLLLLRFANSI